MYHFLLEELQTERNVGGRMKGKRMKDKEKSKKGAMVGCTAALNYKHQYVLLRGAIGVSFAAAFVHLLHH